jgi:2-polyprenyl-3-methyl-5-hydroxy-6-metoxy-1,4-benzoquinol methylase
VEGNVRYGWLKLPGQDGDRTPEEQLLAVWPAIHACQGKTVADLGCAEGAIALEFLKAGAARVLGIDVEEGHLEVARELCRAHENVRFKCFNLSKAKEPLANGYDFVLCLGIAHKVKSPEAFLRFAAQSCRELLLLRSGRGSVNGIIRSKHWKNAIADSAKVLTQEGLVLDKVMDGPPEREEPVEYWVRVK